MTKITPIILSGGSGTRLWPLSRKCYPKQFLSFFDDKTLFQNTVLRISDSQFFNKPLIVCNNEHRFMAANDLQNINTKYSSIILEPVSRNTAPAIALAAIEILQKNSKEDDLMLIMPSDHLIENDQQFIKDVESVKDCAQKGNLITFGIIPQEAETGYGYIKKSSNSDWKNIYNVAEFVEKPDKKTAEEYVASKDYFWNSGMFLFKASTFLQELESYKLEILENCKKSHENAINDLDFIRAEADSFANCENISIDYAVMEKSKKVMICPINIGWSDIGSWQSISQHSPADDNGNNLKGDVKVIDTKNCYINSANSLITTIGVSDLIVVSLKDVTLIANKNRSQDVKKMFEILLKEKREECQNHIKAFRPWGSYEQIDLGRRFKVKRITVKPGAALSLQLHKYRAEHWIVVKGQAHVTNDDKEFILNEDQSTYIPTNQKHRLENKGDKDLEVIEVQTGEYLGEDDIIRFSDKYGR